jgi:hypothetical protein
MLHTTDIDEIEVEDAEGTVWKVGFTREVTYVIEKDYGVDADGNRGERRIEIDDDNHTDTQVFYGGKWSAIEFLHPMQQRAINAAIEDWKEQNEPTIPDA